MTRRDIVKNAIAHKETDRVPYCVNFLPEAEKMLKPYYSECEFQQTIGNYVYQIGPPWWDWYNLPDSYKEFDAPVSLPQTIGTGNYADFFEKCRAVHEETDCYVLATIWGSHFEKAYFARGIENFLADLAGNKEFAQELLSLIIKKNLVMLENIISCPYINGVLLGSDWGSQKSLLMSPKVWRELIAPGEKKEYDLLKSAGKEVWIHSCGNVESIIPDLIEMGVDVLNPLQPECMDIYEIKRKYGNRLTFWGGISTQQTLPYGTPEEVREETRRVIQELSRGGGYIASPAQGIQEDVPIENMLAFIDEIRKFG